MRKFLLVLAGLSIFLISCSPVPPAPTENTLTIVNTGVSAPKAIADIRQWTEDNLHVPVRVVEIPKLAGKLDFESLRKSALKKKHDADVVYIVISSFENKTDHLKIYEEDGLAIINIAPLYIEDEKTFYQRVERQVMRAAAFTFGMEPTPDPFCVTRDYKAVEELDRMGRNYSPPWQGRYAKEAVAHGLKIIEQGAPSNLPSSPKHESTLEEE